MPTSPCSTWLLQENCCPSVSLSLYNHIKRPQPLSWALGNSKETIHQISRFLEPLSSSFFGGRGGFQKREILVQLVLLSSVRHLVHDGFRWHLLRTNQERKRWPCKHFLGYRENVLRMDMRNDGSFLHSVASSLDQHSLSFPFSRSYVFYIVLIGANSRGWSVRTAKMYKRGFVDCRGREAASNFRPEQAWREEGNN